MYFISFNEDMGVVDTAYLFHRNITANHGPPAEIISNRNMRFRSTFWKELMARTGTKVKMSTSGHAQTDSQTE